MGHLARDNDALRNRVRRIAGQVEAIDRALSIETNCATILHLVAATRGAINGLMDEILEAHLTEHVAAPGLDNDARQAAADELMTAIRRYAK